MKYILKKFVDILYLYPIKLKAFRKNYTNEKVEAYGVCKAIKLESEDQVTRGLNWSLAKRGFFILSEERICVDDWMIIVDDIINAELLSYKSGMILKITIKNGSHYQFGLQYTKELLDQKVIDIKIIKEKVKYSTFSLIARILMVVCLFIILKELL